MQRRRQGITGAAALAVVASLVFALTQPTQAPSPHPAPSAELKPAAKIRPEWRPETPLIEARRAFAAVATAKHVYVLGGVNRDERYVTHVEYAPVLAQGKLGAWRRTEALRQGRIYLAAVIAGRYVFAIGGAVGRLGDANEPVTTVERAEILASGALGPWQDQPPLLTPRRGLNAVALGNTIYALGGYNGQFLRSSESAEVLAGRITTWRDETQLAQSDRYIHNTLGIGAHLYLLAGHLRGSGRMSFGDVEVTEVNGAGRLKPWRILNNSLSEPRFLAAAAAANDFIAIIGGHSGTRRLASVEVAKRLPSGSLSPWQRALPLPQPRSNLAAVASGDRIYAIGGIDAAHATASVLSATVFADVSLGQAP